MTNANERANGDVDGERYAAECKLIASGKAIGV
jgi:hypothetical protein